MDLEMKNIKEDVGGKVSFVEAARSAEAVNLMQVKDLVEQELKEAKTEFLREAKYGAQEEINSQVQAVQNSLLTIFGIFASILSFLTIEFQFLSELKDVRHVIGFTLILFASLLGFNIALHSLANMIKKSQAPIYILILLTIILFGLGIWLVV